MCFHVHSKLALNHSVFLSSILSTDQFQTKYYLPVTSGPIPVVPLPIEPTRIPTTSATDTGDGGDRVRPPAPPGSRPTDGGKKKLLHVHVCISTPLISCLSVG